MNLKKNCLVFYSYDETLKILKILKKYKIVPILFFPYYLLNGLGIEWLIETRDMLQKEFGRKSFRTYIDSKNNYGIFVNLVENNFNFIKIKANIKVLKKLKKIARLNKVIINNEFNIIDLSKFKKQEEKLKKLYKINILVSKR